MLDYEGYQFQCNKSYKRKNGASVLYWHCDRKYDIGCAVTFSTDDSATRVVLTKRSKEHNHGRADQLSDTALVRHNILAEAERRPEATPASLLNEFVTPTVAPTLPNELAMKKAIQRRRRTLRPTDPVDAGNILISEAWAKTLEEKQWFMGTAKLGDDTAYIFATEDNLKLLKVSSISYMIQIDVGWGGGNRVK